MLRVKKKASEDHAEKEEEHQDIDFDKLLLIARVKLGFCEETADRLYAGKWIDVYHTYKEIHNWEAKGGLYGDIEKENEQYKIEHQPVASLLSL